MDRLIPLTLQPSRSGVEYSMQPSPPPNRPLPELPVKSAKLPTPEMLFLHPPRTESDWHRVLDEVRSLYLKKHYKQCSARCVRLLEEVKDMEFPLYRIYVSFYAATCLELTGRQLPTSSSKKLQLFGLARLHYQNAQHCMWQVCKEGQSPIEHLDVQPVKPFESSSFAYLERSAAYSRSSVCSTTDSAVSLSFTSPAHSPASSVSSFSSKDDSPETTRSQPPNTTTSISPQPSIEAYGFSAHGNLNGDPALHKKSSAQNDISQTTTRETPTLLKDISITSDTVSYFLFSHSLVRYQAHLASLGVRLTHHMAILDTLIAEIQAQKTQPHWTRSNLQGDSSDLKPSSKRAVKCDAFEGYQYEHTLAASQELQKEHENKMRIRTERIKELKRRGEDWKRGRGRFDGKKYEMLCEEVLRELDA